VVAGSAQPGKYAARMAHVSSGQGDTKVEGSSTPAGRGALPKVDRHRPKGVPAASKASRRRAMVLLGVHLLIGAHVAHWLITGETVTPVEPSEAMQTLEEGRINAGFVLFVCLIAGTLVVGRWFCGWACHVVALQDLCAWLLGRAGLRPRPVRSRLLVFAPFVVAAHMFFWPRVERWIWPEMAPLPPMADWQWELRTSDFWFTFPGWTMAVLTFLVVGFLIVWWLGAKGFCTYGCPYGAFFSVADRVAPMRIRVTDACEHCGHCTATCTSNVRVHEEVARHGMVVDPGCMKCMDCVSVCPKDALYFGVGPIKPMAASQQRIRQRADFSWPEEIAMAVIAWGSAQWVWRGAWFGEPMPLLLAVGMGVLTAVFSILLVRLWTQHELTFQHTPLKVSGRLSTAGYLTVCSLVVFFLLVAHTAFLQVVGRAADGALDQASRTDLPAEDRTAATMQARDLLERKAAWALFADPRVHHALALVYRQSGRFDEAERQVQRALQLSPDFPQARIAQSMFHEQRGEWQQVEKLVAPLLDLSERRLPPMQRAGAAVRLGRARAEGGNYSAAQNAFAVALQIRGDWPEVVLSQVRVMCLADGWSAAETLLLDRLAERPGFRPYELALQDVRARVVR
jgi:polyferredoxin